MVVVESRSAHGAQVEVAGAPPTAETSQPAHDNAGTPTSRRAVVPVFGPRSHTEPMSPDLVAGRHRPSRRATKQFALQARVERAQDNADRHFTTQDKSLKGKSRVAKVVKVKAGVAPSAQVPVVKVTTSGASDHEVEVKDRASRGRHYSRRELARRSHRQMVLADQLGFFAYAAPELVDPSVTVQPLEFVSFDSVETVVKHSPRLPKRVARQLQRQAGVLRFAGVVQA